MEKETKGSKIEKKYPGLENTEGNTMLTHPEVTSLTVESAPQNLWLEFLGGYFDGGVHDVRGSGLAFPAAKIGFDVADLNGPLDGVALVIVNETGRSQQYLNSGPDHQGKMVHDPVTWCFYIKAKAAQGGAGNSNYLCRQTADLLHAVLVDQGLTQPLSQKGLQNLECRKPQVVVSEDFFVRLMRVNGQLHYEV